MTLEVEPVENNEQKEVKFDVVNNNNEKQENKNKSKKNENNKNRRNYNDRNNKRNDRFRKKAQVKCQIPELKDKVFDCTGFRQAEDYKKAKEALESYLMSHCKYGTDIRQTIEKMEKVTIPVPKTEKDADKAMAEDKVRNKRITEKCVDAFVQHESALEENLALAYNIAWDMCTDELKAKVKLVNDYEDKIQDTMDAIPPIVDYETPANVLVPLIRYSKCILVSKNTKIVGIITASDTLKMME